MPAREIAEKIAENVILSRATLGVMYFRIPKTGTLKVVTLYRSQTGGIGGTWYFNVKQNGAGLWTGSNRLTFTLGVESAQKSGLSVAVTEGDVIQLDLEQVGSGSITGHLVLSLDILADDAQSIPAGGTTGQVLTKTSATDYDTEWATGGGGGGGSDYEYDIAADNADCEFLFLESSLDSETNLSTLTQMTDTSGNANHAVQATSGKRAKVIRNLQGHANGLKFVASNSQTYACGTSATIKHVFALAWWQKSASYILDFGSMWQFTGYNGLAAVDIGGGNPSYCLVGEPNQTYFRCSDILSGSKYAVNGLTSQAAAPWTNWKSYMGDGSRLGQLVLYEWNNATGYTGKLNIGSHNDTASRYWDGYIASVAAFSTVKSGDTLRKIRRELARRAGVAVYSE